MSTPARGHVPPTGPRRRSGERSHCITEFGIFAILCTPDREVLPMPRRHFRPVRSAILVAALSLVVGLTTAAAADPSARCDPPARVEALDRGLATQIINGSGNATPTIDGWLRGRLVTLDGTRTNNRHQGQPVARGGRHG